MCLDEVAAKSVLVLLELLHVSQNLADLPRDLHKSK
jgi:hypothetical protein